MYTVQYLPTMYSIFCTTKVTNCSSVLDTTQIEDLNTNRITRILTTDFPQVEENFPQVEKNFLQVEKNFLQVEKNFLQVEENFLQVEENTLQVEKNTLQVEKNFPR